MSKNMKFWEIKNFVQDESADIYLYNEISSWEGEDVTSAMSFRKDLEALGNVKNINVMINSPGGSVGDGLTISSLLQRHPAKVTAYVDGMACSIASVIACAADKLVMGASSLLMIHNALTFTYGNSADLRKQADDLDAVTASLRQMYLQKAGDKLTEEKLIELMDKESWLSAKECMELGLCDEILESNKMVAQMPTKFMNMYNNIPVELLNQAEEVATEPVAEPEVESQSEPMVEPESPEVAEEPEVTEGEVGEQDGEEPEVTMEPEVEPMAEPENSEDGEPQADPEVAEPVSEEVGKIEELTNKLQAMQAENERLAAALNEANTKILSLNEKLNELQPIVDSYNAELAAKQAEEEAALLNEKRDFYKNKFERLGAANKFASKEVQELINKCLVEEKAEYELNIMLVGLIQDTTEKSTVVTMSNKQQMDSHMDNLIPDIEDVGTKYGFR